jgi:hypothetical protein
MWLQLARKIIAINAEKSAGSGGKVVDDLDVVLSAPNRSRAIF